MFDRLAGAVPWLFLLLLLASVVLCAVHSRSNPLAIALTGGALVLAIFSLMWKISGIDELPAWSLVDAGVTGLLVCAVLRSSGSPQCLKQPAKPFEQTATWLAEQVCWGLPAGVIAAIFANGVLPWMFQSFDLERMYFEQGLILNMGPSFTIGFVLAVLIRRKWMDQRPPDSTSRIGNDVNAVKSSE